MDRLARAILAIALDRHALDVTRGMRPGEYRCVPCGHIGLRIHSA